MLPGSKTHDAPARRGRPPTIDRQSVLAAAGAIPSGEFTMAELADRLGVTTAAIYHYFPHRDAIAEALAAELLDQVELPGPKLSWSTWLIEYAARLRAAVIASPWSSHLVGRQAPILAGLRHADAALGVLCAQGFDPADALTAVRLVQNVASMAAVNELTWPGDDVVAGHLLVAATINPDAVETLIAHASEIGERDADREFTTQLDCVIAGIAALRTRNSTEEFSP